MKGIMREISGRNRHQMKKAKYKGDFSLNEKTSACWAGVFLQARCHQGTRITQGVGGASRRNLRARCRIQGSASQKTQRVNTICGNAGIGNTPYATKPIFHGMSIIFITTS